MSQALFLSANRQALVLSLLLSLLPSVCRSQSVSLQLVERSPGAVFLENGGAFSLPTLTPLETWGEVEKTLTAGVLYAVGARTFTGESLIFSIDNFASAPVARPIATFGRYLFDAAIDPTTRLLYVLDSNAELYRLDLTTYQAFSLGRGPSGANSLIFDRTGQAYEWSIDRRLYKVNKNTGQVTLIGDTGYPASGDLAFDLDGTLFGTASTGALLRINPATGASTQVGATGFDDLYGLAIDSTGALFAGRGSDLTGNSQIYRINKTTGRATLVGSVANTAYAITGLALFTPAPSGLQLSLSRPSLMVIQAVGSPLGGVFSYRSEIQSGTNGAGVRSAQGVSAVDNPNRAVLTNPANPNANGSPASGGLARITATYTTNPGGGVEKRFSVPVFGLSCYYTTSEAEWGTPPNACRTTTIRGQTYSGTVTDPPGLRGTYCNSFIAQLKLQGSAYTRDNRIVQYNPGNGRISVSREIRGADGNPVIAGRTLARDRAIIPQGGITVDINRVGSGLIANDIGQAITGYRIDLYKGAGSAVCRNFDNILSVSACSPGNSKCPAVAIPQ